MSFSNTLRILRGTKQFKRILLTAAALAFLSRGAAGAPMQVTSWKKQSDGLLVRLGAGALQLTVWDAGVLHVRYSPTGVPRSTPGDQPSHKPRSVSWTVREAPEAVYLATDNFTARVNKQTGAISYLDRARHAILRELPQGGRTMEPVTRNGKATYVIVQEFTRPPGERLFGVKEYSDFSSGNPGNQADGDAPHPNCGMLLVLSNKGYGLFWNNAFGANFDPAESPASEDREPHKEPYQRKAFRSVAGEDIDYFFLYGPELEQVLSEYNAVTRAP